MGCFIHSKQNQQQSNVNCVYQVCDKTDQAPLLCIVLSGVGGEPGINETVLPLNRAVIMAPLVNGIC